MYFSFFRFGFVLACLALFLPCPEMRAEKRWEKCVYTVNDSDNVWQMIVLLGSWMFAGSWLWRKLTWDIHFRSDMTSAEHKVEYQEVSISFRLCQVGEPPLISKKKLYLLPNPWQLVSNFWSVAILATDHSAPKLEMDGLERKFHIPVILRIALDCHFRFQEVHLVSISSWISTAPALGLAVLRESMIHQKFGRS